MERALLCREPKKVGPFHPAGLPAGNHPDISQRLAARYVNGRSLPLGCTSIPLIGPVCGEFGFASSGLPDMRKNSFNLMERKRYLEPSLTGRNSKSRVLPSIAP